MNNAVVTDVDYEKFVDGLCDFTTDMELAIKYKWTQTVGSDTEIIVAHLQRFTEDTSLGISLEGTVEVENGHEVRPHHYIRSILPDGSVGQNGHFRSGDELLEVNGCRLTGIKHTDVVTILKDLPAHILMVCGRQYCINDSLHPVIAEHHKATSNAKNICGGSLKNYTTMERLVRGKSEGILTSISPGTVTSSSFTKHKSRSLEAFSELAMWRSDPQTIELIKEDRGLGFSILDYQDPMNQNEMVIVIRSLVPGGVAQMNGQVSPGDQLLSVNNINLKNVTLDQAVQVLKSAPKGAVCIRVAKPLITSDSIVDSDKNVIVKGKGCDPSPAKISCDMRKWRYFKDNRVNDRDHS